MRYHSWMSRLADKLGMPAEVLIELNPYYPHVVPQLRERAIETAARWRRQIDKECEERKTAA